MDRLFLDANILFAAAYRARAGVIELWNLPNIELITSSYACEEAHRNLLKLDAHGRPVDSETIRVEKQARFERLVARLTEVVDNPVDIHPLAGVDLPDKDWPILLAAIQANATHLLTADKTHFGPFFGQTIEGVKVILPSTYLSERRERQ